MMPRGWKSGAKRARMRVGVVRRTRRRGRRGLRIELDERVHRHRHAVADDERVQVDAAHVGPLDPEAAEPDQDGGERVAVDRRLAAKGAEQRLRAEAVDQAVRLAGCQRRRRERHVAQGLGEDAAEPEHDARSELRIAYQAGDQLAPPADLLGDEQLHGAVFGARQSEQLGGGAPIRRRRRGRWRRTRSRSVLCAMASPHSFRTTGKPRRAAAAVASAASRASASRGTGTPYPTIRAFEACSDRVCAAPADMRARNPSSAAAACQPTRDGR